MKRRILWINPGNPPDGLDAEFRTLLAEEALPGTTVHVVSDGYGPRTLEYRYYEALVIPDTLHHIIRAEIEGYDAAIIGCFYDPGLQEAREVSRMPVTAPAEASFRLAATLGRRISVIVGQAHWIPQMMENVFRYGVDRHLASFRPIGLAVPELRVDPAETCKRVLEAAQQALREDEADVIVLGCTMEYGLFESIQQDLGIPVIDPVIAALKWAEYLAEVSRAYGWSHSKRGGNESPPRKEIEAWGLGRRQDGTSVWS